MRGLLCVLLTGYAIISMADVPIPKGAFENSACLECHQQQSAELVAAWQQSVHAATETMASCVDCHGNTHSNATAHARRDRTCIDCHGGKDNPVIHSYTTSKHGVLVRLEQDEWDWERPLELANYRGVYVYGTPWKRPMLLNANGCRMPCVQSARIVIRHVMLQVYSITENVCWISGA